jgi:hypothetical protein
MLATSERIGGVSYLTRPAMHGGRQIIRMKGEEHNTPTPFAKHG